MQLERRVHLALGDHDPGDVAQHDAVLALETRVGAQKLLGLFQKFQRFIRITILNQEPTVGDQQGRMAFDIRRLALA